MMATEWAKDSMTTASWIYLHSGQGNRWGCWQLTTTKYFVSTGGTLFFSQKNIQLYNDNNVEHENNSNVWLLCYCLNFYDTN